MSNSIPPTHHDADDQAAVYRPSRVEVVVTYDPDQPHPIAYHRDADDVLVVTFGPAPSTADHLAMVLRREIDSDARPCAETLDCDCGGRNLADHVARTEAFDAGFDRGFREGEQYANGGGVDG